MAYIVPGMSRSGHARYPYSEMPCAATTPMTWRPTFCRLAADLAANSAAFMFTFVCLNLDGAPLGVIMVLLSRRNDIARRSKRLMGT